MVILAAPPSPTAAFRGRSSISSTSCDGPSDRAGGLAPATRLYGRKRGRPLRPGQRVLITEVLPRLDVRLPERGKLDPASLFDTAPRAVWLEIGFGGGEHLAAQAEAHRDLGLIGCEVFENGVARLLGQIARRRLSNIRLFTDDGRRLVEALTAASVERVFILFPDPWPKQRHHKRRILSTGTLDALARIMAEGAELWLATDDGGYFAWMLERVTNHPEFVWLARRPADWRQPPAGWLPTRYEEKAVAAGRVPFYLRARRRGGGAG